MAFAWHLRGNCVAFAWHLRGICVAFAWHLRGICVAFAWHFRGICVVFVWCLQNVIFTLKSHASHDTCCEVGLLVHFSFHIVSLEVFVMVVTSVFGKSCERRGDGYWRKF